MTNETTDQGFYHVLLIGIDAYKSKPLKGCVNDIDSIQRLLIERAKIPTSQITRLVSPHPTYVPGATVGADEATRANIVAALARLGSDEVAPGDRVFIYYAGHGTRLEVDDGGTSAFRGNITRFREALVPVDGSLEGPTVLFDFELNALLANIARRTNGAVSVILDCCHSSGATRSLEPSGTNTRFIDLAEEEGHHGPVRLSDDLLQILSATVPSSATAESDGTDEAASVDDCQVVAACLNHELAKETPRNVAEGETRSGLLTRSLVDALAQIPDEELTTATWGRFWNQVRAKVETDPETPVQHSWMSGGLARVWLAGPPNDGDVGLRIERTDGNANEYVINAGTIVGITKGAHIAVYGLEPFKFPPLGSNDDQAARIGSLLEVTEASLSEAKAAAMGDPFDLPVGARGRMVAAGESERLPCAVVPEDPAIVAALRESDLLEVTSEARAVARLEKEDDGTWVLRDDVHGARPGDPVLARLGPDEVVDDARRVVEHYLRYAGPIRMADRCGDLPNALEISLLDCHADMMTADMMTAGKVDEGKISNLPELARETDGSYALRPNAKYCIRIRNASREKLLVHLFNSDVSGEVVPLGYQEIDGRAVDHFWLDGETGLPFFAQLPDGSQKCIDRFVAIGTTDLSADLKHLTEDGHFRSDTRSVGTRRPATPPTEQWTAVGVIVRTGESAA
ncbi:MAG TPA: caspase family protein [Ilumatobacteraceae bacterium]|nr:caspase family protein [Ilumatobacteraceae bacterium]